MPTGEWTPPEAGDAPQAVKDILKSVYSECRDKNPGEDSARKEKCARIAWTAVHRAGWGKNSDGNWVKESDRRSGNVTTGEFEQLEEATPNALPKKFVGEDGTALIKIIAPGWGSSGYYAEAMLERDAPKVYVPTTHMHIDHPTPSQEKGLPERSLTTLAGVITGAGKYLKNGLQGPGVYAEAKIFKQYRDFLNEMAPYIGVSHRAIGKAVPGTAEGKNGKIIETLQKVMSVDFVTLPGAGGGLVQMYESYREAGDVIQEATGCALALSDVFPGKQWADLSTTEMGHFRSLHAWVGGDGLEDCHLPIKDPDGVVKPECVRTALARLNQVQGLNGSAEASVRSKLEGILNKINKEAVNMEMTSLKLETLKEARPDLIKAILDESERSTEFIKNRDKMTAELEKYKKDNGEMGKEVARLQEAKALRDASAYAGQELAKTQLPEVTKARLQETLPKGITLKEGNLDEVVFAESVKAAIKAESEYVAKITEAGKVRGFGGSGAGDGQKLLKETFKQTYLAEGLSEAEAEKRATIAAQGR